MSPVVFQRIKQLVSFLRGQLALRRIRREDPQVVYRLQNAKALRIKARPWRSPVFRLKLAHPDQMGIAGNRTLIEQQLIDPSLCLFGKQCGMVFCLSSPYLLKFMLKHPPGSPAAAYVLVLQPGIEFAEVFPKCTRTNLDHLRFKLADALLYLAGFILFGI